MLNESVARFKRRGKAMKIIDRGFSDIELDEEDRRSLAFEVWRTHGGPPIIHVKSDVAHGKSDAPPPSNLTPDNIKSDVLRVKSDHRFLDSASSSGFVVFWANYPKRVGKGEALKAWKKLNCDQKLDTILKALVTQREFLAREDGKFTPNPSTWLNQGRWDDEPPAQNHNNFSSKTSGNVLAAETALRMMSDRKREQI